MPPDLFNYYSELILGELEKERGLRIGGQTLQVLIAESDEQRRQLWGRGRQRPPP